MDIAINGIGLSTRAFTPHSGEAYALFFESGSAIGAIESAYALLAGIGYRDDRVVAEHFYFQQDISSKRLYSSMQDLTLRGMDGAALVIPGLSRRLIGAEDVEEADVVAHLFELRRQIYGIGDAPCFVPFHSMRVGRVSSESIQRAAEAVGFVVCNVTNHDMWSELGASADEALRLAGAALEKEAARIIDDADEAGVA